MMDITELLEGARHADPGGPPLLHFVNQLREARIRLNLSPDDIEESVATASLTVSETGGAIRTILASRRAHAVGVYASAKNGWLQPYDGRVERALIHFCEADGRYPDYQSQPAILRCRTPAGNCAWIIDLWRQPRHGPIEAIEVKRSPRDLLKPGYAAKLACAAAVVTALGYRFRLMYRDEIAGNVHRRRNLARIQARRNVRLLEGTIERVEGLAASGGLTDIGSVRKAVHQDPLRGMAFVHRLVASGRILVDLDRFLCDASPAELAEPFPASRIRF